MAVAVAAAAVAAAVDDDDAVAAAFAAVSAVDDDDVAVVADIADIAVVAYAVVVVVAYVVAAAGVADHSNGVVEPMAAFCLFRVVQHVSICCGDCDTCDRILAYSYQPLLRVNCDTAAGVGSIASFQNFQRQVSSGSSPLLVS